MLRNVMLSYMPPPPHHPPTHTHTHNCNIYAHKTSCHDLLKTSELLGNNHIQILMLRASVQNLKDSTTSYH
jgi:hypothetical protein